MTVPQSPTPAQIAAADPAVSAWVGANAGSGKTRVLTQRVARLLLAGAEPGRILCLTYTKAAAAEMQNRLFDMLGVWAMAPDEWLGAELAAIAGEAEPIADADRQARARRLFARALETPGGLKIQTIHAFCDALLRRFPLEAGVSPRFEVLVDRQSALMIAAIRAGMAAEAEAGVEPSFDRIAARLNEDAIDGLIDAVLAGRAEFPGAGIEDRLAAHFGASLEADAYTVAADALARLDWPAVRALAAWLSGSAGVTDQAAVTLIGEASALREADPVTAAWRLAAAFTTKAGAPRSRKGFPTKAVTDSHHQAGEATDRMIAWATDFLEAMRAAEAAARARDLDAFANALLARYRQAKEARALLDFDDLVARAAALLTRSDMAAWALYRLDQGIDHILVDEAQDTAPGQWEVIRAIAHEFNTGAGARAVNRTLFVVGDEKQSIYSFQGAEPRAFGENRRHFAEWLEGMGNRLARPDLVTSFRSAPGILDYVDAVFDGEAAAGLTVENDPVEHEAHRKHDASRIDFWPLIEPDPKQDPPPWWTPVDLVPPGSAKAMLARTLAAEIKRMTEEDRLPAKAGQPGRRVRPGDILVLVARRDALAQGLIRELKALGMSVAGADRLSLAEELAVKDLMALIKMAITPRDDLSLAALLRSPLCGISEEELFELAHGREGSLWRAVMAAEAQHADVVAMLRDMAGQADYLRPYEFLERALIRHDGRRRLLARLGQEAEDPIDEFLAQALAYEASETPSLTGFVAWNEAGEITVKREMERGADEVRVMTVHGAKGLEAPVVILPDTMYRGGGGGNRPTLLPAASGANAPPLMLWAGAKAGDDPVTEAARTRAAAREVEERRRLLYVALTRAEDWLILCAAGNAKSKPKTWYELLEQGMERLGGAVAIAGPPGLPGPVLRREDNPVPLAGAPEDEEPPETLAAPAAPASIGPAPREERAARLSPSGLFEHAELGGAGLGREQARAYGLAVHLLLERLPPLPQDERRALGARLLARAMPELDNTAAAAAVNEALTVLEAPFAAGIFGADSHAEAAIRLDLPQVAGQPMLGRIDRLVVGRNRVLVIDFKTDARPPVAPAETPPAYLGQIACYRAGLVQLYPEHIVEAAILWTAGPTLMQIGPDLLDSALAGRAAVTP